MVVRILESAGHGITPLGRGSERFPSSPTGSVHPGVMEWGSCGRGKTQAPIEMRIRPIVGKRWGNREASGT